jgi:hypothetical protein
VNNSSAKVCGRFDFTGELALQVDQVLAIFGG